MTSDRDSKYNHEELEEGEIVDDDEEGEICIVQHKYKRLHDTRSMHVKDRFEDARKLYKFGYDENLKPHYNIKDFDSFRLKSEIYKPNYKIIENIIRSKNEERLNNRDSVKGINSNQCSKFQNKFIPVKVERFRHKLRKAHNNSSDAEHSDSSYNRNINYKKLKNVSDNKKQHDCEPSISNDVHHEPINVQNVNSKFQFNKPANIKNIPSNANSKDLKNNFKSSEFDLCKDSDDVVILSDYGNDLRKIKDKRKCIGIDDSFNDVNKKLKIVPGSLGEMLLLKAKEKIERIGISADSKKFCEIKSEDSAVTTILDHAESSTPESCLGNSKEDCELELRYKALQTAIKGCESNYLLKTNILGLLKENANFFDASKAQNFIKQLNQLLCGSEFLQTTSKENSRCLDSNILKFISNEPNSVQENGRSSDDLYSCNEENSQINGEVSSNINHDLENFHNNSNQESNNYSLASPHNILPLMISSNVDKASCTLPHPPVDSQNNTSKTQLSSNELIYDTSSKSYFLSNEHQALDSTGRFKDFSRTMDLIEPAGIDKQCPNQHNSNENVKITDKNENSSYDIDEDLLRAKLLSDMQMKLKHSKLTKSKSDSMPSKCPPIPSKYPSLESNTSSASDKSIIPPQGSKIIRKYEKTKLPFSSMTMSNMLDIGGLCLDTKYKYLDAPKTIRGFSLTKFPPVLPVIIPLSQDSSDSEEDATNHYNDLCANKDDSVKSSIDSFIARLKNQNEDNKTSYTPKAVKNLSKEKQEEYRELKNLVKIKEQALKFSAFTKKGSNKAKSLEKGASKSNLNEKRKLSNDKGFQRPHLNLNICDTLDNVSIGKYIEPPKCSSDFISAKMEFSEFKNNNNNKYCDIKTPALSETSVCVRKPSSSSFSSTSSDENSDSSDGSSSSSSTEDDESCGDLNRDEECLRNKLLEKRNLLMTKICPSTEEKQNLSAVVPLFAKVESSSVITSKNIFQDTYIEDNSNMPLNNSLIEDVATMENCLNLQQNLETDSFFHCRTTQVSPNSQKSVTDDKAQMKISALQNTEINRIDDLRIRESVIREKVISTRALEGRSHLSSSLEGTSHLSSSLEGTSHLSSSLEGTSHLSSSLEGTSHLSSSLEGTSHLSSLFEGTSHLSSSLEGTSHLSSSLEEAEMNSLTGDISSGKTTPRNHRSSQINQEYEDLLLSEKVLLCRASRLISDSESEKSRCDQITRRVSKLLLVVDNCLKERKRRTRVINANVAKVNVLLKKFGQRESRGLAAVRNIGSEAVGNSRRGGSGHACASKVDRSASKVDRCASKVDRSASKVDRSASKVDRWASKVGRSAMSCAERNLALIRGVNSYCEDDILFQRLRRRFSGAHSSPAPPSHPPPEGIIKRGYDACITVEAGHSRPGLACRSSRQKANQSELSPGKASRPFLTRRPFKIDNRASGQSAFASLRPGPLAAPTIKNSTLARARKTGVAISNSFVPKPDSPERCDRDADILCPYDLLGRCNDDSCTYRHFSQAVGGVGSEALSTTRNMEVWRVGGEDPRALGCRPGPEAGDCDPCAEARTRTTTMAPSTGSGDTAIGGASTPVARAPPYAGSCVGAAFLSREDLALPAPVSGEPYESGHSKAAQKIQ